MRISTRQPLQFSHCSHIHVLFATCSPLVTTHFHSTLNRFLPLFSILLRKFLSNLIEALNSSCECCSQGRLLWILFCVFLFPVMKLLESVIKNLVEAMSFVFRNMLGLLRDFLKFYMMEICCFQTCPHFCLVSIFMHGELAV